MVLGSIFSFLNPLTKPANQSSADFNREVFSVPEVTRRRLRDAGGPRSLIALADVRALNRQRQQLATNFGFEDTISQDGARRDIQVVRNGPSRSARRQRRTLIGN